MNVNCGGSFGYFFAYGAHTGFTSYPAQSSTCRRPLSAESLSIAAPAPRAPRLAASPAPPTAAPHLSNSSRVSRPLPRSVPSVIRSSSLAPAFARLDALRGTASSVTRPHSAATAVPRPVPGCRRPDGTTCADGYCYLPARTDEAECLAQKGGIMATTPEATAGSATEHERRQIERANSTSATPVVFIHGLWLLPASWEPWAQVFEDAGYI